MREADEWVVMTVRVRVVELVKAARWFGEEGFRPKTRNNIVGMCVETVGGMLEVGGELSVEKAHEILDREWPVKNVVMGKRVRTGEYMARKMRERKERGEVLGITAEDRQRYEAIYAWDRAQGNPIPTIEEYVKTVRENRRKREQGGEALKVDWGKASPQAGGYESGYVRQGEWVKDSGRPVGVSVSVEEKEELERKKREILDEIGGGDKSQALRDMLNEVVAKLEEIKKAEMREGLAMPTLGDEQLG